MNRRILQLLFVCGALLLGSCRTPQQPSRPPSHVTAAPCQGLLKRVTQLDLIDNHPVKSWSACAEAIHQHSSPPVGIAFVDAATGLLVQFEGTYRIETYKTSGDL